MKKVDVLTWSREDAGQKVLFTVALTKTGRFRISGDKQAAKILGVPNNPIFGPSEVVDPKENPERYMEILQFEFTGSRIRATEPYE